MLQKLSLKFSAWTMNKVDGHRRAICINENKILRFCAEDIHKTFGVPCGNRDVKGKDVSITEESIDFIKSSLAMEKAGAHSLRAQKQFNSCIVKLIFWGSGKHRGHCTIQFV
jgi:hypothetical protein